MRNSLSILLLCDGLVAACSSPNVVADTGPAPADGGSDAAAIADTGVDAPTPTVDAGIDAAEIADTGVDAGEAPDATTVVDAGTDAAVVADAGADAGACAPHTFVVMSSDGAYMIDGALNPTLTLCTGVTYMFDMTAVSPSHPMGLYATVPASGFPTPGTPIATFAGGLTSSYTVASPAPVAYRCTVHNFGGNVVVH
jgi:hypothetical protein